MKASTIITDLAQSLASHQFDRTRRATAPAWLQREYQTGWNDGVCCHLVLHLRSYLKQSGERERRAVGRAIREELELRRRAALEPVIR